MASFEIFWKQSAVKELRKLPREIIAKVHAAVAMLANEPHPQNSKKLKGVENSFRIRVGDYRVVYGVFADRLLVEVVRVGHRRQIYRR